MDKVRLGRVLGKATRLAARTAYEAVQAAKAPDPRSRPVTEPKSLNQLSGEPSAPPGDLQEPGAARSARFSRPAIRSAAVKLPSRAAVAAGTRSFQKGALNPLRQASRALWLEVTGSFFALFALSFAAGAWKFRSDFQSAAPAAHLRAAAVVALAILFGWFSVSSFVRARRRA